MCTKSCIDFGHKSLAVGDVAGKRVLEVGSRNVNGTLRTHILSFHPAEYKGVDIQPGPCVDRVCDVCDLTKTFGKDRFDIVISTEMMEHVLDWRKAIRNMKDVLIPGGIILITTRSKGFAKHDHPNDYWRFSVEDMQRIFKDYTDVLIEKDKEHPGVLLKARKPMGVFPEIDLSEVNVYGINEMDICIYYRTCNKENNRNRPKGYSKQMCYQSFLRACGLASFPTPKIVCDGESPNWVSGGSVINLNNVGNSQSLWWAYQDAINQPDDYWILFSEDDYYYLPEAMTELNEAIKKLGVDFLAVYDHPGRYQNLPQHNLTDGKNTIALCGNRHWRSVPSTTMTFAASVKSLRVCHDLFSQWICKCGSTPMSWELFPRIQGLRGNSGKGFKMMGPMPTLATDCTTNFLSPCVDWSKWGIV